MKKQSRINKIEGIKVVLTVLISVSIIFTAVKAGSLNPSASPAATMKSLLDVYNSVAGTFDSSGITASSTGSLMQNLKYIVSNLFWASSSDDVYATNSGGVGIGTSTPSTKLHVVGSGTGTNQGKLLITSSDNEAGIELQSDNSGAVRIFTPDSLNDLRFYAGGDTRMVIQNSNVGIGTVSPDYELDVSGNIGLNEYLYHNDDTNTYLRFVGDQALIYAGGEILVNVTESSQDSVKLGDGGDVDINLNDDLFVEGSSSKVGIGTITPNSLLSVGSTGNGFQVDSSGNVAYGTWQGTAIGAQYGGTGQDMSSWTGLLSVSSGTFSTTTTGANTALSNLSHVAINTSLVSDTDNGDNLGSSSAYWANTYTRNLYMEDGSNTGQIYFDSSQAGRRGWFLKGYDSWSHLTLEDSSGRDLFTILTEYDYGTKIYMQGQASDKRYLAPYADSTYDLGESSLYWANIYADKVYLDSDSSIVNTDVDNWNTAYGWGSHAVAGYLSKTAWNATTTDALDEGSTNLYSQLTKSGSNLYYNSGRIGIGTTTPARLLDVDGVIRLETTSTPSSAVVGDIYQNGTNLYYYNGSGWDDLTSGAGLWNQSGSNIYYTAGNVGIGDTTPDSTLEIKGSGTASTTSSFSVTDSGGDSLLLVRDDGSVGINLGTDTLRQGYKLEIKGGALCVDDSTLNCPAYPTAGAIYVENSVGAGNVSAFDIAEFYSASEEVEKGDLLILDEEGEKTVKKSREDYDPQLIGVVSTNPAIVMDEDNISFGKILGENFDPHKPYVALAGRVPVKVSSENGSIEVGDYLTSSFQEGVAMRATGAGRVIGMALEPYESEGVGEIMIFVNPHWFGGQLSEEGLLGEGQSLVVENSSSVVDLVKSALSDLGMSIRNGIAKVKELIADRVAVKEIQMTDRATGAVYCTWIENGEWVKVKGECGDSAGDDSSFVPDDSSEPSVDEEDVIPEESEPEEDEIIPEYNPDEESVKEDIEEGTGEEDEIIGEEVDDETGGVEEEPVSQEQSDEGVSAEPEPEPESAEEPLTEKPTIEELIEDFSIPEIPIVE